MTTHQFARQIEYLLFTGAIQGNQILSLHHLLICYGKGEITSHEMQDAINQCDPDQIDKFLDQQFPHQFD